MAEQNETKEHKNPTSEGPVQPENPPKMTYGEFLVRLKFNPSGMSAVDKVKKSFADAIDVVHELNKKETNPEAKRAYAVAITNAQQACMWAVNALTAEPLPEHLQQGGQGQRIEQPPKA